MLSIKEAFDLLCACYTQATGKSPIENGVLTDDYVDWTVDRRREFWKDGLLILNEEEHEKFFAWLQAYAKQAEQDRLR